MSEGSERRSYWQSYIGLFDDIQTSLKPLKNRKKLEHLFLMILGLTESFKTINQPDSTMTLFDNLFLGKH